MEPIFLKATTYSHKQQRTLLGLFPVGSPFVETQIFSLEILKYKKISGAIYFNKYADFNAAYKDECYREAILKPFFYKNLQYTYKVDEQIPFNLRNLNWLSQNHSKNWDLPFSLGFFHKEVYNKQQPVYGYKCEELKTILNTLTLGVEITDLATVADALNIEHDNVQSIEDMQDLYNLIVQAKLREIGISRQELKEKLSIKLLDFKCDLIEEIFDVIDLKSMQKEKDKLLMQIEKALLDDWDNLLQGYISSSQDQKIEAWADTIINSLLTA